MTGALEKEILALPLDEALLALEKAGIKVEVLRTGPPRLRPGGTGSERVLRFILRGGTGIVTVARESAEG